MESQSFWHKSHVQSLLTLILISALAALASYTYYTMRLAKGVYTGETTITVQGEGKITARPDVGMFNFAVNAEGEDASMAQASANEAIDSIVNYLKEEGVEEADIDTANYNLNPTYHYEERVCLGGSYCPPGERILDGYEVYQSVTVKVRDLEKAGTLISGVGERGATNISQLQFTIDDESSLKAEARQEAIANAREKAEILAADLDMKLSKIVGFYEENNGRPVYGYGGMEERAMAMSDSAVEPAVLPAGEDEITSFVNITYQLK